LLIILLSSCGKDDGLLVQPAGIKELIQAHNDGWTLEKVFKGASATFFGFQEGSISIDLDKVYVYDCTAKEPDEVYLGSDRCWAHGSINTGVRFHEHTDDINALPVYLYFTNSYVVLHLSNGSILKLHITHKEGDGIIPDSKPFTMPAVHITYNAQSIDRYEYCTAEILIEDPDKVYSDEKELKCKARIRGRGQSTWNFPKKPLKIKFDEQHKVLGMAKNKDWNLLANYCDKSLLRNAVGMKTSEILDMDWTPGYRKVELWLNEKYMGVYDLFEAKEVTKHKVDIDLAGGDAYIEVEVLEYDFMTTYCSVPLLIKEPEDASEEFKGKIKRFANDFENVLFTNEFSDPVKGYAKYIDVESFINNYIIEELAKDIDGSVRKSSFLVYDSQKKKLKFYHEWDFDLSYGNADYFPNGASGYSGWFIREYNSSLTTGPGWYRRLFEDPAFANAVRKRWDEVYADLEKIPDCIDAWVLQMGEAPGRNFALWDVLGKNIWPNVTVNYTYGGEIVYLKKFYTDRLHWINQNL